MSICDLCLPLAVMKCEFTKFTKLYIQLYISGSLITDEPPTAVDQVKK